MREFKFRAWIKKAHQIADWKTIKKECDRLSIFDNEDFVFNQYTGLKDKNGKEIYDLQILNNKYIVAFHLCYCCLVDISNGDIKYNGIAKDKLKITGEYFALSENAKRDIDEYLQQAKRKIENKRNPFAIL